MRKLFVSMVVTLDGFFEGPNRDISWHNVDKEFNDYAIDMLNSVDILLFGRVTYELMASYWPTTSATANNPIVASKMNSLPKIVFSTTLKNAGWNNTRLVRELIAEEILELKKQPGKDLVIFGSGTIVSVFTQLGLIDEYRIIVNPVILGNGNSLFNGVQDKVDLKLSRTKVFRSGNVLLCYHPIKHSGWTLKANQNRK